MEPRSDIALLAPVPLVHLEDGELTCRKRSKVAFGSRRWDLFRELDQVREGSPVEVYIYASHVEGRDLSVTWHGLYTGHVESVGGLHPNGAKFRPPSAMDDGGGYWAVFWEITDLKRIDPISTGELRKRETGREYGQAFVPEGPIIIECP